MPVCFPPANLAAQGKFTLSGWKNIGNADSNGWTEPRMKARQRSDVETRRNHPAWWPNCDATSAGDGGCLTVMGPSCDLWVTCALHLEQ